MKGTFINKGGARINKVGRGQDGHMTLTVARQFRGPDRSGNGGYTAGLLAGAGWTGAQAVTVTLRQPPPLDIALSVVLDGAGIRLMHGDEVVATAEPGSLGRVAADPVPFDVAVKASEGFAGFAKHPFPGCFTCGPARTAGDGLRVFPGPVGGDVVAAPWVPADGFADAAIVWAALDCPGGWSLDLVGRPMVLGRIPATVASVPSVGERCVVVGHARGIDGRKGFTDSALYGEDGRLLARAEQTWIAVDPAAINALR